MTESTARTESDAPDVVSLDDLEATPHADLFPDAEPKTIRLVLEAGQTIAPHQHPDRQIVFHVLEGRLSVTLDDESYELAAGDVARFDGDHYVSPEAIEASTALLVLAERAD